MDNKMESSKASQGSSTIQGPNDLTARTFNPNRFPYSIEPVGPQCALLGHLDAGENACVVGLARTSILMKSKHEANVGFREPPLSTASTLTKRQV